MTDGGPTSDTLKVGAQQTETPPQELSPQAREVMERVSRFVGTFRGECFLYVRTEQGLTVVSNMIRTEDQLIANTIGKFQRSLFKRTLDVQPLAKEALGIEWVEHQPVFKYADFKIPNSKDRIRVVECINWSVLGEQNKHFYFAYKSWDSDLDEVFNWVRVFFGVR